MTTTKPPDKYPPAVRINSQIRHHPDGVRKWYYSFHVTPEIHYYKALTTLPPRKEFPPIRKPVIDPHDGQRLLSDRPCRSPVSFD
jgi:hypothetical protein